MQRHLSVALLSLIFLICSAEFHACHAEISRETRRELSQMSKDLRKVSGLIRKKKIDDALELIRRTETRIAELNISDDERDRVWTVFQKNLERARSAVPVSFETEVAPVILANCTRCHGPDRSAANLRLDTFNGFRKGGRSGALIRPRKPTASLLIARLTSNEDRQRMPRNADRLQNDQLQIIARWIAQGAVFDGDDPDATIGQSANAPPVRVDIPMADGTETVSFTKEVAPILVNFCLRCHRGNEPSGGFSVVTIADVIRGGDTGDTIVPGSADDSYLWALVWRQDPIKMPQGQALLKRSQARTIRDWINEGARFDGTNTKATLRSMVPTEAELASERLTTMTDEDFAERRIEQAGTFWKQVAPREEATSVTTDNFYVYGNVEQTRLDELGQLAEEQVTRLQTKYDVQKTPWRGRLIVFATKDRFDYTEFNTVLRDQRTPREVHGHVVLTPQLATAYVALHDRPDERTESDLTLKQLIAQAWLARDGSPMPSWLQLGFGIVEGRSDKAQFQQFKLRTLQVARNLNTPADVFKSSSFAPADVPVVGAMLTQFLLTQGKSKFTEFVQAIGTETTVYDAISAVYRQPAESAARAFLSSLSGKH